MKTYHPLTERIVDILVRKVNNENRHFFRILVGYYLSKVASMMRCNIATKDRGVIPVNTYVLNLMVSGAGKGHSTNIMEQEFVARFKKPFLAQIFPVQAQDNIATLAMEKARDLINTNQSILPAADEAKIQEQKLQALFERLGELAFSFDSATTPAVKQMREKLLLACAGSMNLELDEVGSNLSANVDVLTAFLELYDIGLIKQKLTKNTNESIRSEEFYGNTPTNLMMFGTPTTLLDGSKTEEQFKEFLETGYARRLLFGYTPKNDKIRHLTAEERYNQMVDTSLSAEMASIQRIFEQFANRTFNPILNISKENSIKLITYQMECETRASEFKDHLSTHKAEMTHRYYKALKLAGAYAFADGANEISADHLEYAINLVEDSGECFNGIMKKRGAYDRLANYLADADAEVTQHELIENLPFYKGSEAVRRDMITLATSFGYKNNIIIKKRLQDGIEFFSGETLQETDLNKLTASVSQDITQGFTPTEIPFDQLHKMTCATGWHYTAHSFVQGHRKGANAVPGFNMLILDCDGDASIDMVKVLLEEYTFFISTTKRHTADKHRFRLILPMSHTVKLNPVEHAKFMENVFNWLPFSVDEATKDISRKWESHAGSVGYNNGQLIDATMFIPETKKSEEMKVQLSKYGADNMERWFRACTATGNRANHLYRYGMVLIDAGYAFVNIVETLTTFNASLDEPISSEQLEKSTLASLAKKYEQKTI
ncbi:MAG: DUF3987 domain-containing protein [Nanoarchaeota archaeon]|nr:DUF3987 domain-containing protein [Nanoarchaeota archaeon]